MLQAAALCTDLFKDTHLLGHFLCCLLHLLVFGAHRLLQLCSSLLGTVSVLLPLPAGAAQK
jgi:hypothetical protein